MLHIFTIEVTPFAQNARVLHDPESGSVVIVDPGGDLERILKVVWELEPKQLSVFLTHAHIDHAGATARCLKETRGRLSEPVQLFAHPEPRLRGVVRGQAEMFGLPEADYEDVPDPDVLLDDGATFQVGSRSAQVLATPGHAPDHLSLFFPIDRAELHQEGESRQVTSPILLAGDALFAGSIGRTDLPGGSMPLLLRSIREKLLVLPPETLVLPGHGPATTIGHEKLHNPFLQG